MGIAGQLIDVARDWKRIADHPGGPGSRRLALWATHLRLKLGLWRGGGPGQADVLGFRVSHLGRGSLLHLYREIFVDRIYDVELDSPAPTIIDCGSNIGMSILRFKTLFPQARIIGFEPHPQVHEVLVENIRRNALASVTVHRKALARECGELEFFADAQDPGALNMGLFADRRTAGVIRVEADRLSNHIDGEVDLLKLDIEGAEEMVLAELAQAGKLRLVRHIVCEYHHHIDTGQDRLSHTLALLEQAGFGYQIGAHADRPAGQRRYQDVVIHAYRKDASAADAGQPAGQGERGRAC